jgi:hypothetical protein
LFGGIALHSFFAEKFFISGDQAVAHAMLATHGASRTILRATLATCFRSARSVLASAHINKGGTTVDLSLRLNVLAVCAVFVFVGAVLLGAF